MKRIFFILIMFLFFVNANAQDLSIGLQAKNDGNDAFRNKDYVSAITNWEKYLNSGEEGVEDDVNTQSMYVKSFSYAAKDFLSDKKYKQAFDYFQKYLEKDKVEAEKDPGFAYSMAYCAMKLDKNDLAISYFQKAIDFKYRADYCTFYVASIYKDINDEAKMKEVLINGLEKYPNSKVKPKLVALLTIPMLQEAAIPFNEANELAKVASSSDPNEYLTNMANAVVKFEEAIPLFNKVLEYDPSNDQAKAYLKNSVDNIDAFNTYRSNLEKK
ncbi:MAG: tetratricopeptide repeat protein [Prolixibacteraceae bacterium]